MKWDEIVKEGKTVDRKTFDAAITEKIESFDNLGELNKFLLTFDANDAHIIITELVTKKFSSLIKNAKMADDKTVYQEFQSIKEEAKKKYDYWHKTATIKDVESICQKYYGIEIRMIGKVYDELSKVEEAINIIEERIGINKTNFNKEDSNDTAKSGNEQGSEEVTK